MTTLTMNKEMSDKFNNTFVIDKTTQSASPEVTYYRHLPST